MCNVMARLSAIPLLALNKSHQNCFKKSIISEEIRNNILTQCGQLHVPSGAFSMSGSRQTIWYALGQVSHKIISPPCWQTSQ